MCYNEHMEKREYASKQYFFWNDKPYKVIKEYRRKNLLEAWDIKDQKKVALPWTEWKRHRKKAFVTSQVAKMLGRHHIRVRLWLSEGLVPKPFSIFEITGDEPKLGNTSVNYLWSEEDVYTARDYMESTGRKDAPSRAQIQAMINNDKLVQYIQDENGEFIPLWRAG